MISLSDIYTALDEIQTLQKCGGCRTDCPYYISANYGKECALETVMHQIAIEMNEKKV